MLEYGYFLILESVPGLPRGDINSSLVFSTNKIESNVTEYNEHLLLFLVTVFQYPGGNSAYNWRLYTQIF